LKGAAGTVVLALATARAAHGASLLAVRVWPGRDYTRVTLEHDEPLKFSHFMLRDAPPLRLVVDVEGIVLTSQLKELVGKIDADDPYIAHVRIGQNRPDVVRLVIELKADVNPQLYQLDPVGPYRYRLLFDLYPQTPPDPLMALTQPATPAEEPPPEPLAQPQAPEPAAQPQASESSPVDEAGLDREIERAQRAVEPAAPAARAPAPAAPARRLLTVAIDAGHGGCVP